ncbi:hypothetical protein BT93_L4103 [Corymbia citriodora subsp. variegata]|uniref:Serine carboxypeptidase n=1 Tax=Corymbia citriodora subsp. variegata TaxID=360336 RepID=A0A8T0CUL9_CORYI|nr:hypothetical protein BT93_L4103 [Corymbia citriodora subsp. variegata]
MIPFSFQVPVHTPGHFIPQLAQEIPLLTKSTGDPGRWEFYWIHGLISDTTYENMRKFCSVDRASEGCRNAWQEAYNYEIGVVNIYNMYARPCENNTTQDLMYRDGSGFCLEADTVKYLKGKEVQGSFHVDPSYIPLNYTIYSGTTDVAVPLPTTRRNIAALKLKVQEKWYPWYHRNLIYEGLTFVAVMGASHEVPMYLPSQAHTMFQSFLSNVPMPKPPRKRSCST